eukprot:s5091_g5.t1
MREITAELKEYDHLFREEDTATEKRVVLLAAIFKRVKERRGSESEAAGTPVKPSGADDEKKRVPIPKKMPAEHKARFLEKRKRGKVNEEKMKDLKERLEKAKEMGSQEKAKEMGSQKPNEPVEGPKEPRTPINRKW